jgi:hypothetical protein
MKVDREKFENAVRPLMKYMAENFHPHSKIIVDSSRAELVEGVRSIVTNEFIVD